MRFWGCFRGLGGRGISSVACCCGGLWASLGACCCGGVRLRRSPIGAVALTARAHDCGPEPSLRTSPSSSSSRPTAFPSDSLGRIEVARSQGHRADGLPLSWVVAMLGGALVTSAAGPAEWRPRGRPYSAYASVGVSLVVAFANLVIRFLMFPPVGVWGVKGGAQRALPCAWRSVARHPGYRAAPENSQQLSASSATLSQKATSASRRNIALYMDCGGAVLVLAITNCFLLTMSAK
ncbi:hypothetical protein LMG3441_06172 [Achromobacter kerstersii]|uniref:Uncharacterized protein n=1 Tax=Achromobacter kerstersii TaxID=1353890 RepID=A0A6S7AR57_9BURK|nr:hypothetical protein LMG3441_06172 [Achromobacter kerstersii]